MKGLLLLSSDDRARYAEDVQTALALPAGAPLQFRYRERWVTPTLQRAVPSGQAAGLPAIVGFVGSDKSHPFLLPIRYATVARAEYVADMFIFKLRLGGYVNMQPFPLSQPDLMAKSRELISQLESNGKGRFYPASSNFPQMPEEVTDDVPDRWLATARRLALHPTFANSYFLRVAPVETQHGKELQFGSDGRIEAIDGQSLRIVTNLFGEQYAPDSDIKLTCSADDANLRVASDDLYQVSLRYDSVEFWLHSAPQSYDTYSRVKISLASEKAAAVTIPANVPLDLVIRRPKSRTLRRWIAASAGAVLVAMPAILGPGSPLQLRIAAALVGAGLLAFSGAVLSSPK